MFKDLKKKRNKKMDLREVSNNISNILLNLIIFLNLISKKFLTI